MMHESSESDTTSVGQSSVSPRAYFVQSPDSNDEMDKCSSSSNGRSPMDSPSYPRHSTTSSSSSVSRIFGYRRRWNKHYCDIVPEESGRYDDDYDDGEVFNHCTAIILVTAFGLIFGGICLGVWSASTHYTPQVTTQSFRMQSMYFGEGSDHTGVPTKLMTVNCSAKLLITNPSTFFGIHITSQTAHLIFSQRTVATGHLTKYYQPRKSSGVTWVTLVGKEVPLYGAGLVLATYNGRGGGLPFKLDFNIQTRGYAMGKLLKTKHTIHFECSVDIGFDQTKQITFQEDSCKYF